MAEVKNESKKPSKWGIAAIVVVSLILIAVIVLACVNTTTRLDVPKDGIASVQIVKSGKYVWDGARDDSTVELLASDEERIDAFLDAYDKATTYGVGYGMLNGIWFERPKATEMTKNPSGVKDLTANGIQKMVVVRYDSPKTITLEDEEITYTHLFVFVKDSSDKLSTYSFYPIDGDRVLANDETYSVKEYKGWMNGTSFDEYLKDAV